MISFARGAPAPECLDAELLADCARAAILGDAGVLAYGPGGGYEPLRAWLGARHGFDDRAVSTYISPPLLTQAAVHELIARGAFEPNLERITGLLRAQRDAMLESLDRELGDTDARWSKPDGGYFVWLDLPGGADATALLERATEAGVTFVRGRDFFPDGSGGETAARLAFSYESPARVAEGVGVLAALLLAERRR